MKQLLTLAFGLLLQATGYRTKILECERILSFEFQLKTANQLDRSRVLDGVPDFRRIIHGKCERRLEGRRNLANDIDARRYGLVHKRNPAIAIRLRHPTSFSKFIGDKKTNIRICFQVM